MVGERNVRVAGALKACASLRGRNVFLDHALDAGRVRLPEGTRLIGYPVQEQAFLVFLATLAPHLPRAPKMGSASYGELTLRSESGATWHVWLQYGDRPEVRVRRLAWIDVPMRGVRPLEVRPATGARAKAGPKETLYVDPEGSFVALRVAGATLHTRRGHAGEKGRSSKKVYAHRWQADAALERAAKALRKSGYRRRGS